MFSELVDQVTNVLWTVADLKTDADTAKIERADAREAIRELNTRMELQAEIAVSDVEVMLKETEDRIVSRVVKELEERENKKLFSDEVKRATKAMNDSGYGVVQVDVGPGGMIATSTPNGATHFSYPGNLAARELDFGEKMKKRDAECEERIRKIRAEHAKEVAEYEARVEWLEEVIDQARDIRRRCDLGEDNGCE